MWLFIGRAVESVVEADVATYIKNKCTIADDDLLVVKPLSSTAKSRSFQVGIDPKYYSALIQGEFWPAGIVVRRFNFRAGLGRNFLGKNHAG